MLTTPWGVGQDCGNRRRLPSSLRSNMLVGPVQGVVERSRISHPKTPGAEVRPQLRTMKRHHTFEKIQRGVSLAEALDHLRVPLEFLAYNMMASPPPLESLFKPEVLDDDSGAEGYSSSSESSLSSARVIA